MILETLLIQSAVSTLYRDKSEREVLLSPTARSITTSVQSHILQEKTEMRR